MIKQITPIILVLASLALFSLVIVPRYQAVQEQKGVVATLNEVLDNSKKVQAVRDSLLSSYNNIADADLSRLRKVLPDHVDNVRLVLEVDRIASRNNMILQNVSTRSGIRSGSGALGPDESVFGRIRINFSLLGRYESLVNFLSELEQSLRVVDIMALSFVRGEGDFYKYDIELDTYWLK